MRHAVAVAKAEGFRGIKEMRLADAEKERLGRDSDRETARGMRRSSAPTLAVEYRAAGTGAPLGLKV